MKWHMLFADSTLRVAIVTNQIPRYRWPIFKMLSEQGCYRLQVYVSDPLNESCLEAREALSLKAVRGINLRFTTQHEGVATAQTQRLSIPILLVFQLIMSRANVIIAGDLGLRTTLCWLAARLSGARLIIWSEEIQSSARGRSRLQHFIRRFLLRRADGFLPWGAPAEKYLLSMGAAVDKIVRCVQAIDTEFWIKKALELDRQKIRAALGLQGRVILLVGRLVALKGFARFLHAWAAVDSATRAECTIVIVGDGERMSELQELTRGYGLSNVRFEGHRDARELAEYYCAADAFVFPSQVDVWGLVVNEALCFGLPILASCHAGASQELIAGTQLGELFDPLDSTAFADRLQKWLSNLPPIDMERGQAAIRPLSFEIASKAFQTAIGSCFVPSLTASATVKRSPTLPNR